MKIKTKKPVKAEENDDNPGVLRFVDPDLIVTSPDLPNRKTNPDHVASLKKSIRRDGLDVPLGCWNGGADDNMVKIDGIEGEHPATFLVAGRHRQIALNELRSEEPKWFKSHFPKGIPVTVRGGTLQEAISAQLRENVHRENPEAAEILPMIKRLSKKFKMKNSEIARSIGKSKAYVGTILDIESELGSKAMKKVEKGEIGLTDAVVAAQDVKRGRKSGKKVDADEAVAKAEKKAKSKGKTKDGKDKKRAAKRMGAKALHKSYNALPTMSATKKLIIAEGILAYLAGENDDLPKQITSSDED